MLIIKNAVVNALVIILLSLFFWLIKFKLDIMYAPIILLLLIIFLVRYHNIKTIKDCILNFISMIAFNVPYVLYKYNYFKYLF